MRDEKALNDVVARYQNEIHAREVSVFDVTDKLLGELREVCHAHNHMEIMVEIYDDESDWDNMTWRDIEGEGYGWLWVNEPKGKWLRLLQDWLDDFVKGKRAELLQTKEKVLVVQLENLLIYHFIERDSNLHDTIFTFSNDEIEF